MTLLNFIREQKQWFFTLEHNQQWPDRFMGQEMDLRDPLLDNTPTKEGISIRVDPVTNYTNESLNDVFTKKTSGANRRSLRSQYTLPQNDLTTAPVLDAIMDSKPCKSMDHKSAVLAVQHLEVLTHILQY